MRQSRYSTLTQLTLYLSWSTQLWLNSMFKFASLTQLRLNSFESRVVSQNRLITFCLIGPKVVDREGGAVECSCRLVLPHNATDKCKILTFSLPKNQWLNFDSSSIQLTQLWLKLQSAWFDSDSTHILEFHGLLNSVAREIHARRRLIWVRVESNLTHESWVEHNPAPQPWFWTRGSISFL